MTAPSPKPTRMAISRRPLVASLGPRPLLCALFLHAGLATALAVDLLLPSQPPSSQIIPICGLQAQNPALDPLAESPESEPAPMEIPEPELAQPSLPPEPTPEEPEDTDLRPTPLVATEPTSPIRDDQLPFQGRTFRNLKATQTALQTPPSPPPVAQVQPPQELPLPVPSKTATQAAADFRSARPRAGRNPLPPYSASYDSFYDPRRIFVVLVSIEVDAEGRPGSIRIIQSCGIRPLDQRVRKTVRKYWRFEPASRQGHHVQSTLRYRFAFGPARSRITPIPGQAAPAR